jgi:predicted nucleic-acid-binding Zn-ribbon protein
MKITGTFKTYDQLKLAYGNAPGAKLDDEFDSFLKKIAGKNCVLANYTPVSQTFDTTLLIEDPSRPGSGIIVQDFLDGRSRRYGDNMGIDKLASIVQTNTIDYIYCTKCGYIVNKLTRYDYEPLFSYGDIFTNNITGNLNNPVSITGTTIKFKAAVNGRIFCPKCRSHEIFKEVSTSFI